MGDAGVIELGHTLAAGTCQLANLNMSGNHAGVAGCREVGEGLRQHLLLKRLSMARMGLGDEAVSYLALALHENTGVQSLDLSGNAIRSAGAACIATLLGVDREQGSEKGCRGIDHLDLSFNPVGKYGGNRCGPNVP
jgi:Ran GTPase-activating protein (RanGAP) involved in mRNA processing and transport